MRTSGHSPIADCERDLAGTEAVRLGIAHFRHDGEIDTIVWI
jgi:hypothetical protein